MTPKSYGKIAEELGISLCSTDEPSHDPGFLGKDRVVHWQERRVTRSGIKRFLMVAAPALTLIDPRWPQWYQFWKRVAMTRLMSERLHVRLKPTLWRHDKARLLAMLTKEDIVPYRERLEAERARALRWARR